MTFEEAVSEAWEQGWYVYSLCYEPTSEGFPRKQWRCTLRALEGPPRRQISYGVHDEACLAVCDALAATPDIELEVIAHAAPAEPKLDLVALMRKRFQPLKRRI